MNYYRDKNINDIDKYIINTINNINVELEKLDKRTSNLENGNNSNNNNNVLKDNNNEKYFYMIKNFQIPYEDYILLNKTYDYIKSDSKINVRFSCDFSTYEKLTKDVRFRIQILDDNDIIYSQDKNDNTKYNGDYTFEMIFNIDKEIKKSCYSIFYFKRIC